jgi:hypothetical protein
MKSILLTITLSLFIVSFSHAQAFHIGAKVGANINKISGQSFKDEFTFGYHAGGFAEIKLSKRFALQPEVLFNQFNTDTSTKFSQIYNVNAATIASIKLNYLSIPILLNYKVGKVFSIQAGPQYGILMDQNSNLLQNGKNAFKNGDFSLLAGAQCKLGALRLYGRYQVGLSNINDIDNKDKWKNQSIQIGIGLAIL